MLLYELGDGPPLVHRLSTAGCDLAGNGSGQAGNGQAGSLERRAAVAPHASVVAPEVASVAFDATGLLVAAGAGRVVEVLQTVQSAGHAGGHAAGGPVDPPPLMVVAGLGGAATQCCFHGFLPHLLLVACADRSWALADLSAPPLTGTAAVTAAAAAQQHGGGGVGSDAYAPGAGTALHGLAFSSGVVCAGALACVAAHPTLPLVAVASSDGRVWVHEVRTPKAATAATATATADGQPCPHEPREQQRQQQPSQVAAPGRLRVVEVWAVDVGRAVQRVCEAQGRDGGGGRGGAPGERSGAPKATTAVAGAAPGSLPAWMQPEPPLALASATASPPKPPKPPLRPFVAPRGSPDEHCSGVTAALPLALVFAAPPPPPPTALGSGARAEHGANVASGGACSPYGGLAPGGGRSLSQRSGQLLVATPAHLVAVDVRSFELTVVHAFATEEANACGGGDAGSGGGCEDGDSSGALGTVSMACLLAPGPAVHEAAHEAAHEAGAARVHGVFLPAFGAFSASAPVLQAYTPAHAAFPSASSAMAGGLAGGLAGVSLAGGRGGSAHGERQPRSGGGDGDGCGGGGGGGGEHGGGGCGNENGGGGGGGGWDGVYAGGPARPLSLFPSMAPLPLGSGLRCELADHSARREMAAKGSTARGGWEQPAKDATGRLLDQPVSPDCLRGLWDGRWGGWPVKYPFAAHPLLWHACLLAQCLFPTPALFC